jgi:NadR type nicotinamide-nucleotide adenylyltransferase
MKAYPFHLGHNFLIETALEKCDVLYVLVCTLKRETINGKKRFKWFEEQFFGNDKIRLIHVEDEVPQEPKEHPDFWNIWKELIFKYAGNVDYVFTSEEYGYPLAGVLNSMHVLVDLKRENYPVSGTKVRSSTAENWHMLPNPVKKDLVKKIVILGPESTGKSALARTISDELNLDLVTEYGREFYENLGDRELAYEDLSIIASEQLMLEESISEDEDSSSVIICDTNLVVTEAFGKMLYGKCPKWIERYNESVMYDLCILLRPDVEFVQDGTRNETLDREKHYSIIYDRLNEIGQKFVVISGKEYVERTKEVFSIVNKFLKTN